MRNIPFAFLNEETIDQINRAHKERRAARVNAMQNLASTQLSMRGLIKWPSFRTAKKRLVAMLEKMMEMSGPNSIANLERALRAQNYRRR